MSLLPISILIPTKNEEKNIARCLESVYKWADEIIIVDSQSTDQTLEICKQYNTKVLQFNYKGGWPKKRQWALDTFDFKNDWILLLDSDEILLPGIKKEIETAVKSESADGYWMRFQIYFLGKMLRHGGTELWKLSLFRKGKGAYEKRLEDQDESMADMEVHEHVIVDGKVGRLKQPVKHENINALDRYIQKHNEYSNWEALLHFKGNNDSIKPNLFGNQTQRRRWLKKKLLTFPGSSFLFFLNGYLFKLGFLDGRQGFIYAAFRGTYMFNIKAKIFELKQSKNV